MNRRFPVRLALLASVVGAFATLLAVAGPASSRPAGAAPGATWHDGPCAADDNVGITVVIDFQELGGGVNVRCTGQAPTDGADALDQAGIAWQGVVRWGRGFVCKIAGKPADAPCIDTPPASAYWSYWVAPRGGRWCFSNVGVLNRTPPPGSVEGWSFSLEKENQTSPAPGYAPPKLAAGLTPNPLPSGTCDPAGGQVPADPTTTVARPPAPTVGQTAPGSGLTGRPGQPDATGTTEAPATTSSSTSGTTTTSTSTSTLVGEPPGDGREGGSSTDGQDASGTTAGGGSGNAVDLSVDGTEQGGLPAATIAGLAAIAILAAAGIVTSRRRSAAASASVAADDDQAQDE